MNPGWPGFGGLTSLSGKRLRRAGRHPFPGSFRTALTGLSSRRRIGPGQGYGGGADHQHRRSYESR